MGEEKVKKNSATNHCLPNFMK